MWWDPDTERRRAVWAFVLVLACSRHMFVRPVLTMDQRAWTQAHVEVLDLAGVTSGDVSGFVLAICAAGRAR